MEASCPGTMCSTHPLSSYPLYLVIPYPLFSHLIRYTFLSHIPYYVILSLIPFIHYPLFSHMIPHTFYPLSPILSSDPLYLFIPYPLFSPFIPVYNFLFSHFETPANGQALIFLTGLLEVFISEISLVWQQYRTTLSVIKPSLKEGKF